VAQSVEANAKDDGGHPVWPHHQSAAVAADGSFSFKIETLGDFQVCAAAPNTPPAAPARVHLEGVAARPEVTLVLRAPVELSGHVISPDGQKHDFLVELQARDASEVLAMDATRPKFSIPERSRSTRVTGDGSYRFDRLPAGVDLEIRACPRTVGLQRTPCTAAWIPVPHGTTSFDFVAGDDALHHEKGKLLITVKSSSNQPVAGTHWYVLPEGQDSWTFNPAGAVPADGSVSVTDLDPTARYTLVVTGEGFGTLDVHDLQPTVAGLPVEAVLPRPAQLELQLVDAAGQPVASAPVTLKRSWQLQLGPVLTPPISTDPHGKLHAQDLAPGHYTLSVDAHGGHLETTLDLAEGQLLQSRLLLEPGGAGSSEKKE
jgi:hypothetical protein